MATAWLLLAVPSVLAQENSLAHQYLDCLKATWQEDASSDDIDALERLYADDAIYQHSRVGISIEGRAAILGAMSGFLGASRSPQLSGVEVLMGTGVAVVAFDLQMDVRSKDGWQPINRHQLIVLEISDDRITKVSDYW